MFGFCNHGLLLHDFRVDSGIFAGFGCVAVVWIHVGSACLLLLLFGVSGWLNLVFLEVGFVVFCVFIVISPIGCCGLVELESGWL